MIRACAHRRSPGAGIREWLFRPEPTRHARRISRPHEGPVVWTDVTNSATVNNGLKVVILSYTTTNRFYSLVLE